MTSTIEEVIAKELYSNHPLEKSIEFIKRDLQTGKGMYSMNEIVRISKVFAKLHVEAALKAAAENADWTSIKRPSKDTLPQGVKDSIYVSDPNGPDYEYYIDKSLILSAYPLENIK